MTVSERVKHLRIDLLGLTQAEFGQELGVSGAAASRLESGDRGLTSQMAAAICRRWGVSEVWLRTGEGDPFPAKSDDIRLAEAVGDILAGVSGANRHKLLSILCSMDDQTLDMACALADWFVTEWQKKNDTE